MTTLATLVSAASSGVFGGVGSPRDRTSGCGGADGIHATTDGAAIPAEVGNPPPNSSPGCRRSSGSGTAPALTVECQMDARLAAPTEPCRYCRRPGDRATCAPSTLWVLLAK